jgi:trigger factor
MSQEVAETETADFEYPITVEDAGPAAKKISVEIPEDRIKSKLAEQFGELEGVAQLPGFRPGKAPRSLLEKRFSTDVRNQVRDTLLRESYQQAISKNSLSVLGEPEFEDQGEPMNLPASGPLKYTFTVETTPEITLPDLGTLEVKKPVIQVNDEHVQQALQNLREQQGALVPVEGRGVQAKDYLTADVKIKLGDELIGSQNDAQVVVRPGVIGGVEIKDLEAQLEGAKVDETRTIKATAPEQHPAEKIRGKEVEVELTIKDIKALELAEIDDAFLESLGFENQQQLLDELRVQMVERINNDVQVAMHNQVRAFLQKNIEFALPTKLTTRQESRVINRRANELMMRGMPADQIRANLDKLQAGAADQAKNELKLFFTLAKYSEQHGIEVDESEVNGQIAQMAMMQNQRPEKLKQDMGKNGQLGDLWLSLRERKTLDKILESAKVEEVEVKGTDDASSVSPDAKDAGETASDAT